MSVAERLKQGQKKLAAQINLFWRLTRLFLEFFFWFAWKRLTMKLIFLTICFFACDIQTNQPVGRLSTPLPASGLATGNHCPHTRWCLSQSYGRCTVLNIDLVTSAHDPWPVMLTPCTGGLALLYISAGRSHWLPARHLLWEMKPRRMPLLGAFGCSADNKAWLQPCMWMGSEWPW